MSLPLNTLWKWPPGPWPDEARHKRWKYIGYPGAASWMASDDDFFVLPRFDTLNTRLILDRKAQIENLELKLAEMDEPTLAMDQDNSTALNDKHPHRPKFIKELWSLMKDYSA